MLPWTAGSLFSVVLPRCGFIEHSADLTFFLVREGSPTGGLRLEQRAEEYAVILSGAFGAQLPLVGPVAHSLGLEDLGFTLAASLAQHSPQYT